MAKGRLTLFARSLLAILILVVAAALAWQLGVRRLVNAASMATPGVAQ